tara:strand:- start:3880 stop:5811 length:1932 start_codon:yes stop_codon:yes gene_type:complete
MHFKLENFSGIIPKRSDRLLPSNNATIAKSTELYSGELRGIKRPQFIRTVGSTAERAFRVYVQDNGGDYKDAWVTVDDATVNLYRGPTINDQYQRHYWTGSTTYPSVADGQELYDNEDTPASIVKYRWGIPNPTVPCQSATGPSDPADSETRVYTYTYVNQWGEESGPAKPSDAVTGGVDANWNLTAVGNSYSQSGFNPLDKVRIYRTVTGTATTDFRLVAEISIPASGTYTDTLPAADIVLNEKLSTTNFDMPPGAVSGTPNLEGLVSLPNGVLAGFLGTDVYLSEPYLPYSFPRNYVVSTGSKIVGLGVFGSGLIVCTESSPLVLSGAHPDNMTMIEIDQNEPCLSYRSIVSTATGVFYASQNGLVQVTEYGAKVISREFVNRSEWHRILSPENVFAAVSEQGYIGLYSKSQGFILGSEADSDIANTAGMVTVGNLAYIDAINNDPRTGEVFVLGNGQLFFWNQPNAEPLAYTWQSKAFETPYPVNFSAFKVKWQAPETVGPVAVSIDTSYYNTQVFNAAPLHTYAQYTFSSSDFNGTPRVSKTGYPADKYYPSTVSLATGCSNLIPPLYVDLDGSVRVTIYARLQNAKEYRVVYSREVTNERIQRMPSTFKADLWKIKLESSANVFSFAIAETGRELAKV